jgi:GNAT superfamily N-acetyltransferase
VRLPATAIRAVEANLWEHHRDFTRIPGGEVHETSELLWYAAPSTNGWFNGASKAALDAEGADEAIETTTRRIHALGRNLLWHVGPRSQPLDLVARLEGRGFRGGVARSMVLAIDDLAPVPTAPGLVIAAVRNRTDLLDWLRAWDLAVGLEPRGDTHPWLEPFTHLALPAVSPTELFVGRLDGEPACCSMGFVGGGAVGLYAVGTPPAFRGRGFGAAISAAAVRWGGARGERFAILHASEMGEPVYRRLGFRPVGELTQLTLPVPKAP